jgi:hypothetical protein
MSDLILFKDRARCPKCFHARPIERGSGHCACCNTMLFPSCPEMLETNPERHGGATRKALYEFETNDAGWWAYDAYRGWMHRDHWSMNIRPNPAGLTADDLGTNRRETADRLYTKADIQRTIRREKTKYKGKRVL